MVADNELGPRHTGQRAHIGDEVGHIDQMATELDEPVAPAEDPQRRHGIAAAT